MSGLLGIWFSRVMILVTGAGGYLGGRVVEECKRNNIPVIGIYSKDRKNERACDLLNPNDVKYLLDDITPKRIIHCAASVPKITKDNVEGGYQDKKSAKDNYQMTLNLVNNAKCPIVFTSSMTVYDKGSDELDRPVQEKDANIAPTNSEYALGKWLTECMLKEKSQYGVVALRLPGLFGTPRFNGIIYNAARAFLLGKPFTLNEPVPLWATMEVGDAARACIKTAQVKYFPRYKVVNVGYNGKFSIDYAISLIAEICNTSWKCEIVNIPVFEMDLNAYKKFLKIDSIDFKNRVRCFIQEIKSEIL